MLADTLVTGNGSGGLSVTQLVFDAAKLALQFIGALIIARLTVRWALARYKSERTWERRLAAYADVVSAISEMQLVVGERIEDEIEGRGRTADDKARHLARYDTARRRLEDGAANALLLLPTPTGQLLQKLFSDLEDAHRAPTLMDYLENQYGSLRDAAAELIKEGRTILGVAPD